MFPFSMSLDGTAFCIWCGFRWKKPVFVSFISSIPHKYKASSDLPPAIPTFCEMKNSLYSWTVYFLSILSNPSLIGIRTNTLLPF